MCATLSTGFQPKKNPADRGTVAELSQHRDYDAPVPIYELSYLVYYYLEIML